MNTGIIGAGHIGGSLTRRLSAVRHKVFIANLRGPASLAELARETGATAVTAHDAARRGDIVIVTIPERKIPELPKDLSTGVDRGVVVVDTGNYYPRDRDGRIKAIEDGLTDSRWVESQLGRQVLKAFNNMNWRSILNDGKPAGATGRIALPVAGDDSAAKERIIELFDDLGFDGVDAGGLDQFWRQRPSTPVYGTNLDADGVRQALAAASPVRKPEWFATSTSPGAIDNPA